MRRERSRPRDGWEATIESQGLAYHRTAHPERLTRPYWDESVHYVFEMDEVRRRGLATVFNEALAIMRQGTAGFGVSVDLDALDPEEEPGVGTPVPGGLCRAELADALSHLRGDPDFVAMEIVEYNPRRDRGHATADAAGALVGAITPL